MRIKEVIQKTGLSRRTIQFYISQKLITPKEDPVNGYHDFQMRMCAISLLSHGFAGWIFPFRISAISFVFPEPLPIIFTARLTL